MTATWDDVSDRWVAHWARLSEPAREALLDAAEVGAGTRLLDVGCGSGELCALALRRGAVVTGADSSPRMLEHARRIAPGADLHAAPVDDLPLADGAFDVVTAINALQFASSLEAGWAEAARVVRPGGLVGVSNWGPRGDQQLSIVTLAIRSLLPAEERDAAPIGMPIGDPGVLESLAAGAGQTVVDSGDVVVAWEAPDEATLLDAHEMDVALSGVTDVNAARHAITEAAAAFRRDDGSYRFENRWRWVLARR